MKVNKCLEDFDVEVISETEADTGVQLRCYNMDRKGKEVWLVPSSPLTQVISNGCFVQPLSLVQELGDVLGRVPEKIVFHQEHDTLHLYTRQPVHQRNAKVRRGNWSSTHA